MCMSVHVCVQRLLWLRFINAQTAKIIWRELRQQPHTLIRCIIRRAVQEEGGGEEQEQQVQVRQQLFVAVAYKLYKLCLIEVAAAVALATQQVTNSTPPLHKKKKNSVARLSAAATR